MPKAWQSTQRLAPFFKSESGASVKVRQRHEVDDQHKWRLTDIYESDQAWHDDLARLQAQMPELVAFRDKLAGSGQVLFDCLDLRDKISILYHKLQLYAYLSLDEDNRESRYQAMTDEISALGTRLAEAGSFITPEIMAIADEHLAAMKSECASLKLYDHHLEDMRRLRAHILPAEQERLMALAGNVTRSAAQVFRMIDDADLKFGEVTNEKGEKVALTKQRYYDLLESYDREVRRTTMITFNEAYLKFINALGATLSGSIYADLFYQQARNYDSCLQAALAANNIPEKSYRNLTESVQANLDSLHRYTAMRKRVLGVDEFYPYDIYVPLVPDAKIKLSYDQARAQIIEALAPLGDDYVGNLIRAFDSGWIDVYETEGKGSGAYSWSTYAVHPFILMNFNDTLDNMFTLAHELGHGLHSQYSRAAQPFVYSGHAIFTAEVASTTNEALLMHYVLERTSDPKQRAYLLNYQIQSIVGTFFTQTMYSEFEDEIHKQVEAGKPQTASSFREAFREIYQEFWGPELKLLDSSDIGCLRIPHFYRSFYVYQYATSFAASSLISEKILSGDIEARDRYLEFLKSGESNYPIELLKAAGVDLTSPEPVRATIALFDRLVAELEELLVSKD
ncbi:MAG: oligoendopeptidase F [bacterium]